MKWLYQAWRDNHLYDWAIAGLLVLGALCVLALLRYVIARAVAAIARRTVTDLDDHAAKLIAGTKLWLLFPLALYAGASALEIPAKIASSRASRRVVAMASSLVTWTTSSTITRLSTAGTKPAPMPWI